MVQTSSFIVLAAVAFTAVSAVPVHHTSAKVAHASKHEVETSFKPHKPSRPDHAAGAHQLGKPSKPEHAAGVQGLGKPSKPEHAGAHRLGKPSKPEHATGVQGLGKPSKPEHAGAQRLGRPKKVEHNGIPQSLENTLKDQNAAVTKLKTDDASSDRKLAMGYEADAKAFNTEAQYLNPVNDRAPTKKARRALRKAPASTGPHDTSSHRDSRPVSKVGTAAHSSSKSHISSQQQQLQKQKLQLQKEKEEFASKDMVKAKQLVSEANAYTTEAQHLEPSLRKQTAKPHTYQQDIASQNLAVKGLETQYATEDRQRGKQFKDDSTALVNQANKFNPAPSSQRPSSVGPRDLEDEAEFFAREWDEYSARASDPSMATSDPSEAASGSTDESIPVPHKKPHHHHHKKGSRKMSKHPRDLEFEDEAFAREWAEFVTREWAALEELD